ncbi:hypothetical protein TSOC_001152 [Tetrabaena socialis]|uniref:phytol kinase n=1 Tax=Tetrabaena socialis TaxID=47790 RepID=A0A2J8AHE7_9CHLO|nr:hypothetical protein TSOC_001152 [Tetrabaena socialis]|eukprot:PNH11940.1 hypothetical protein TSOC_001152 [Tetrabaena socialis]
MLRCLPGLAERLLRSGPPPLSAEGLHEVQAQLRALRLAFGDTTAARALLSNDAARGALLTVLAVAHRQPLPRCVGAQGTGAGGGSGGGELSGLYNDIANEACICCHELLLCELPPPLVERRLGFALRLLRTQPLQCCARRLADAAAALHRLEREPPQGGEGPRERELRGEAAMMGAARAHSDALVLAILARNTLSQSMYVVEGLAVTASDGGDDAPPHSQQQAQLRQALALALRDSGVLEHAARTLLLLLRFGWQRPDLEGDDSPHVLALSGVLDYLRVLLPPHGAAGAAPAGETPALAGASALREVLSGRCMQHTVLVLGVGALCAADGGPSYGLPLELLRRVPLIRNRQHSRVPPNMADLRGARGRHELDVKILRNVLQVLCGSGARVAPPGPHGALALLLRLCRLAVASGRAHLAARRGSGGSVPAHTSERCERSSGASSSAGGSGSSGGSSGGSGGGSSGGSSGESSGNGSSGGSSDNGSRGGSSGNGSSGGSSGNGSSGGSSGPPQPQQHAAARRQLPPPPSAPGLELVLSQGDLLPLFSCALEAAMDLCFPDRAIDKPQRAAARADCWRLFAAYTRDVLPLLPGRNPLIGPVLRLLDPGRLVPGAPLPPSPPPSWAAALAGGWLPCLERLLRRGGDKPSGPEASLAASALFLRKLTPVMDCLMTWRHATALLAYGEPREAAALVATLGKLLRAADPAPLAAAASMKGALIPAAAAIWILKGAISAREASDAGGRMRGGFPGGAQSAAGRQLALMVSYALCEWLPPLARLAARAVEAVTLRVEAGQQRSPAAAAAAAGDAQAAKRLLFPVLIVLHAVARRCRSGLGDAAGPPRIPTTPRYSPAAGGSGDEGADGDGDGGWRQLLLNEVGAVPLLGAALHAFAGTAEPVLLQCLARACCAVAVACPCEPRFPWRPELLHELAEGLPADGAVDRQAALSMAVVMLQAGSGEGAGPVSSEPVLEALEPLLLFIAWQRIENAAAICTDDMQQLAAALVPVAQARGVLRTCSYPGCVSLAGDSEAEAEAGLLTCGRCGTVQYCCGGCQANHWRAGHRKACVPRG